ncbi:MAG: DUF2791 family P-loop domain-containing protein [candidate division Zixibacteria bacterium]|nr:DUF2791 family P-loop domain-containing protein [candidate division Zixibacteria bacterium]
MAKKSFIQEKYKLKESPFREIIATEFLLKSWVDREAQVKEWNHVIQKAIKSKSNFIGFIVGDYGMGKTMSLLKILEDSKKHDEIFPIYLNFLGEQKPKNPGIDFIQKIFKSIDFQKLHIKKQKGFLIETSSEVKSIYQKILYGEEDIRNLALYFLRGEVKPNQSQLKKLEVVRKIDDIEVAKEYLTGFLCVLKSSGFSTLLLAVDEFEYLFSLVSKASQSIYLAALRGLYDLPIQTAKTESIANILFFIAISDDGRRRMQEMEKREASIGGPIKPLMRRVQSESTLKALSKEDTGGLIENRLRLNRITGRLERDPLIPFTKKFVRYVFRLTGGRPSDIIVRCDHVLDAGLEARVPRLTADFAKEVFEKRGFPY